MTTKTAAIDHVHITEREADGTWEDCTWCSGLEWYRLTYDERKPATHVEAEALRAASGEPTTGGSNLTDFARGVLKRYGVTLSAHISGFAALKSALTPGKAALVQGSMKAFGSTNRLSVWDPAFDGGHAVMVMNLGGTLWWCDPEAPATAAVPVTISWTELAAFVNAFAGVHLVRGIRHLATATVPAPSGDIMPDLTSYTPGYTAGIKALSNVRAAPAGTATKLRTVPTGTTEPVVLIGTVKGTVDPANGSDVWYVWWKNSRYEYTAKDNIVNVAKPAADDGYTKATQDAAVAAARSAAQSTIDAQAATIAEQKTELSTLVALKAALKALLG